MSGDKDGALEFTLWESRPMMILCLAFIGGLSLSFSISLSIPVLVPSALVLLACAFYFYHKNINITYILCLLFFLIGCLCGAVSLPKWRNDRSLPGPMDGFGGTVAYIDRVQYNSIDIVIDDIYFVKDSAMEQADGRIILTLFGDEGVSLAKKYAEGTGIFCKGCPELPTAAQGYGMFSSENYYLKNHIRYTAYAHYADADAVSAGSTSLIVKTLSAIRQYIISVPMDYIGEAEGGLMAAFMTGNMDYIPYDVKELFAELGLSHVLAVSGLHIVILLAAWQMFAEKLRIGFVPQSLVSAFLVILFLITAGVGASISRAVVMWACVILSKVASRQYDGLNVLGFAAFMLLLVNPLWILDIGFLLSFLSVAALLLIGDQVNAVAGKLKRFGLIQLFLATISVMLFTWPVNAYLFNYLPVLAPFANVVFVPALSLALALGFMLVVCSALPFLAGLLGWAVRWYLRILLLAMDTLGKLNLNIAIRSPTVIVLLLAMLSVLLFSDKVFRGRKTARAIISGAVFTLSAVLEFLYPAPQHFQKVYAGYSCNYILMRNEAGVTAVINEYDGGLWQSIRNQGFDGIDNLVFSGNDADDLSYMLDTMPYHAIHIYAPAAVAQELGNPSVLPVVDGGIMDAGLLLSMEPFKAKSADAKIHYAVCFDLDGTRAAYLDPMSLREGSLEECGAMILSRWSKARVKNLEGRALEVLVIGDGSGMFAQTTAALVQSGTELYNTNRGAVDLAPAD